MDFHFTPTANNGAIKVPYFEDAKAAFAPYYDVRGKSIAQAQAEVTTELGKLGAGVIAFDEGFFGSGDNKRYGYVLRFLYGGAQGVIRVAGLPIRHQETEKKLKRVRLQALMNVRDWLKAAVTSQVFSPGSEPLIGHLLVDGTHTVADLIAETGNLPRINPPPAPALAEAVVDGEFTEA